MSDLRCNLIRRSVGLAEQDCFRVERIACVHEGLDGAYGELVHHFQAGGNDPLADDRGNRLAGAYHVVESGKNAFRVLRLGQELDRDLGDHREQAFRAVDQR